MARGQEKEKQTPVTHKWISSTQTSRQKTGKETARERKCHNVCNSSLVIKKADLI